ncbi:hypothetical protein LBMAG48_20420 [Phycisphaerae bacterium]|nr:hypothetical protein LBMAG48_20420 [Phycisphaerae bacterium]
MTPNESQLRNWTYAGWLLQLIGFGIMIINFNVLTAAHRWSWIQVPLPLVAFVGSAICFGRAIYLKRRNKSLVSRGECHACGYTLSTGMHTCPECGQQRRV